VKPDRIEARQAGNGPLSNHPITPKAGVPGTPATERAVTDLKQGSMRSVQTSSNNSLQANSRSDLRDFAPSYPEPC